MKAKLTSYDAEMIRVLAPYASVEQLAREYGVTYSTVWNVLHYRTWRGRAPRRDRKYNDDQVRAARKLWAEGFRDHYISKQTGMPRGVVRAIISGETYKDVE